MGIQAAIPTVGKPMVNYSSVLGYLLPKNWIEPEIVGVADGIWVNRVDEWMGILVVVFGSNYRGDLHLSPPKKNCPLNPHQVKCQINEVAMMLWLLIKFLLYAVLFQHIQACCLLLSCSWLKSLLFVPVFQRWIGIRMFKEQFKLTSS